MSLRICSILCLIAVLVSRSDAIEPVTSKRPVLGVAGVLFEFPINNDTGVLVTNVIPGFPATNLWEVEGKPDGQKFKLVPDQDVIVEIDKNAIKNFHQLREYLRSLTQTKAEVSIVIVPKAGGERKQYFTQLVVTP